MAQTRPRAVAAVLVAAGIVSSLVYSLAIPLLAVFPEVFSVSGSSATWIVVANSVAGAVATPVIGRMGDTWGPRRTLMGAMCSLVVGSLVCAVAPNLAVMVLGRVLQGAAAGTVPLGIGILRSVMPEQRIGLAVGTLSATLGVGSGVGITLAGVLLSHGGWRLVFASTAALAVLVALLIAWVVPKEVRPTNHGFDYWGAVGLAAMLTLVLIPVSKGVEWSWTSPLVLTMLTTGVVVGLAWARFQWRLERPMVNLRIATSGPMAAANVISLVIGGGIFFSLLTAVMVIQAPQVTGYGLGRTALVAGVCLIPGNLMMIIAPIPAARCARKYGVRLLLRIGLLVMALGYGYRFAFENSLADVVVGYLFVQVGVAACLAGLPMAIVRHAPRSETSSAQAIGTTMRQGGIACAGAGYAALIAASNVEVARHVYPTSYAMSVTFIAAIAVSVVGVIGTFVRLRPRRPSA